MRDSNGFDTTTGPRDDTAPALHHDGERSAAGRGWGDVPFRAVPNGLLHLGHAYSALLNAEFSSRADGRLLLRLEDIDLQRCRQPFALAIEEDLHWLGLDWEPAVRRQSQHFPLYAAALRGLEERGLVYPCFCSRAGVMAAAGRSGWPSDPDGGPLYPGLCRALGPAERRRRFDGGQPYQWRLDMARALSLPGDPLHWTECDGPGDAGHCVAADPARWGDVTVARKDVPTSYHLSVVIDDAAQGVTDIVRGQDLFAATGLQRLLQRLLGLPTPRYHHHRLILDEAGHKLSKSRRAPSLRDLRREGVPACEVKRRLGFS